MTVDPEPITPVASAFVISENDIQQWGKGEKRSAQVGYSEIGLKGTKIVYTNDAENVSISSSDCPNLGNEEKEKIKVR